MDLQKHFSENITPAFMEQFGYKNVFQVPKVKKISVNVGINSQIKERDKLFEVAADTLKKITGQSPVKRLARKSISGFKIRKGMPVGLSATLRGKRMYDFIERLNKAIFPRLRDFRGIPESTFDKDGNMTIGFRDVSPFPEVQVDAMERAHGLEVTIVTTAKNKEEGIALLKFLGFPLRKQ